MKSAIVDRRSRTTRSAATWITVRQFWPFYLMALPAVISILIFSYAPLFGLVIAFLDYKPFKGLLGSEWVGLANFNAAFQDPFFWTALKNSIVISGLKLAVGFPAGLILALLLNEVRSRWFSILRALPLLAHQTRQWRRAPQRCETSKHDWQSAENQLWSIPQQHAF